MRLLLLLRRRRQQQQLLQQQRLRVCSLPGALTFLLRRVWHCNSDLMNDTARLGRDSVERGLMVRGSVLHFGDKMCVWCAIDCKR